MLALQSWIKGEIPADHPSCCGWSKVRGNCSPGVRRATTAARRVNGFSASHVATRASSSASSPTTRRARAIAIAA
eukprot:9625173-Alexandrium_andersonii.AAC.1